MPDSRGEVRGRRRRDLGGTVAKTETGERGNPGRREIKSGS